MKLREFTQRLIDAGGEDTYVVRRDGLVVPVLKFAEAFVLVANPDNIELFSYTIYEQHNEDTHKVYLYYKNRRANSYGWENTFPQYRISSFKYSELDTLLQMCVYTIKHHTPLHEFEKWLNEHYEDEYGVIKDDSSDKKDTDKIHNIDLDEF